MSQFLNYVYCTSVIGCQAEKQLKLVISDDGTVKVKFKDFSPKFRNFSRPFINREHAVRGSKCIIRFLVGGFVAEIDERSFGRCHWQCGIPRLQMVRVDNVRVRTPIQLIRMAYVRIYIPFTCLPYNLWACTISFDSSISIQARHPIVDWLVNRKSFQQVASTPGPDNIC